MSWAFPYRGETEILDSDVRAAASGSFLRLSDGFTHYELGGPEKGQAVVLVHGFSVPYFIWDPTFQALTGAGLRVLRYDLFGRGFSDRPKADYNLDLFCRQLADLLEALGFKSVDLIGLSMGGPITASFTDRFPVRVRKLVLIDPSGARSIALSPVLQVTLVPGLGELALGLLGSESLVRGVALDFFDPLYVEMFQEKYRAQLKYRGFKRAILSTLRSGMLGGFPEIYRRVGRQRRPVLLFWGRNDTTVPFEHSRDLLEAIPHAEFYAIDKCGHIPHYEKAEIVNPILIRFLKKRSPSTSASIPLWGTGSAGLRTSAQGDFRTDSKND